MQCNRHYRSSKKLSLCCVLILPWVIPFNSLRECVYNSVSFLIDHHVLSDSKHKFLCSVVKMKRSVPTLLTRLSITSLLFVLQHIQRKTPLIAFPPFGTCVLAVKDIQRYKGCIFVWFLGIYLIRPSLNIIVILICWWIVLLCCVFQIRRKPFIVCTM